MEHLRIRTRNIWVFMILLLFTACEKEELTCGIPGEIIAYDSTECACCPGWVIATAEDTIKILNLPDDEATRERARQSGYPIPVQLDYEDYVGFCDQFYKKLSCFELR